MKTLTFLLLRGLPGSGKSTYATSLVAKGFKRLNKDSMRDMVDAGAFSQEGESIINDSLYWMAEQYLMNGYNVVSDNMNFQDFHFHSALRICGKLNRMKIKDPNVRFEVTIKDFDTPLDVCIERDARRPKPVTAEVITKIAHQYLRTNGDFPGFPGGVYGFQEEFYCK